MNRLTRLVNSFESKLLLPATHHLNLRSLAGKSRAPALHKLPCTQHKRFSLSISVAARRRNLCSIPSTMDLNSPEKPDSSTIEEDSVEDFVTVEKPTNESPMGGEPSSNPNPNFGVVDSDHRGDFGGMVDVERVRSESGEESSGIEDEKKVLPEELSRNVVVLSCESTDGGTCDVYLVGTAHVSQESCREVQAVISFLKPQAVFLELCSSRVAILTLGDLKVPTMSEMIDMWKKKQNLFGIIYSWFLAKVADKLEVLPGSEFRVAFEEARKYGSRVILGDRPVQVTLRRTWGKMPLWHKTKLLYSFLFQAFFLPSPEDLNKMLKEMDDVDMLTLVIQEMSKEFPTLMETLVNERDRYMSSTLLRVASEHSSVVAVVGKGHLQGIKKHWKQPVEVNELLEIPSKSSTAMAIKILTSVGIAVAGAAVISGLYLAVKKHS
ncbi:hypothetical protein Ancab_008012 [Ancistrocladus abbreviatus]